MKPLNNPILKNRDSWLADFSDPMRIFTVIVVTEMMVLVYSLSFLTFKFEYFNQLALLSLMAQLIAISVVVVLTAMREFFNQFQVLAGLCLVMLLTLVLAAAYTWALAWIDQALMFDWIDNNSLMVLKISLATAMTLLALMRYFYVQDQWEKQVEALAKAQMNALQARIKPHFLYNSLNSIASLIPIDQAAAEKAVLNLSGLFRKAFANHKQSITTLSHELEWIEEYLAIEKLRLMDRLNYQIDVDDDLLTQKIPLLSIQPLVENAVIHGISHLSDGGLITLVVAKTNAGFYVKVVNPYFSDKVTPGHQTGLENIRKRLALTYGERAEMTVESGDEFVTSWEVRL